MHNRPGPSGSGQAVPLLAEITATTLYRPPQARAQGKAFTRPGLHPTPASAMARRPHVSSISSLVHPHDTSQDSDDPEAQSGVLPDDATLLPATRRPVASRGIVDTRICRSLSSCNVNATPLQEQGHLDSGLEGDARQRQLCLGSPKSPAALAGERLSLCGRAHGGFRLVACD